MSQNVVLRSATKELLAIPKTKTATYGDRAFFCSWTKKTGTDYRTFYVKHKPFNSFKKRS